MSLTLFKLPSMLLTKLFAKQIYTRSDFFNSLPKSNSILEIGPFYSPFCKGSHVKYFDILNREQLVERAMQISKDINLENIPVIDFVSATGDISVITETFDIVFSSHVIEHQWDFINHLQKVSKLLKSGSKYYAIIPDKRYCFDHFNTLTTVADIINANVEKPKKHSVKSVIEHRAFTTHNDPVKHWKGDHGFVDTVTNRAKVIDPLSERIKNAIAEFKANEFVDVHAWYFTPESFAEIVNILAKLEYIQFTINKLYTTQKNSLEFFVVLEKTKELGN